MNNKYIRILNKLKYTANNAIFVFFRINKKWIRYSEIL